MEDGRWEMEDGRLKTEKLNGNMKRIHLLLLTLAIALCLKAQDNAVQHRFSPEKFDADLREFITKEAKLTEQETAKFFPVYKEMQTKQREVFGKQKALAMSKPEGEKACKEAIRQRDENELEMKRIQQSYHEKFMKLLPASKVYAIMQAEDSFHRRMLRMGSRDRHPSRDAKGFPGRGHNWKPKE